MGSRARGFRVGDRVAGGGGDSSSDPGRLQGGGWYGHQLVYAGEAGGMDTSWCRQGQLV